MVNQQYDHSWRQGIGWFVLSLPLGALILMAVVAVINCTYGLMDINLIYAFETDEGNAVKRVAQNIREGNFDPNGHYNYGYLYESTAIRLLLWLKGLQFNVDTQMIGFTLRLVSWLAFLASFATMTYLLTRFGVSSALAAVSSLYFVSTPDFYHWSQSIHPDVLQTFLILATFTVLTRSHSLFSVFLATAIGGLAFGTKYAGIFLLPFLPLPYALRVYQAKPSVRASVPAVALAYLLTASIFLIVFLSVNPYVVTHFTAAWADFTYESRHVKIGDTKVESPSPLLWIPVLTGEFGIWGFVLVLAGFSILVRSELQQLFAQGASKYFSDMNRRTKITLILYSTCCLLYLFSMVRMRVPRFLFHVSPIIVVLSTLGYWDIVSRIRPNWIKTKLIPSMLFLLLIPSLMSTLKSSREYSDKANSPLLKQGQFLLQHFDSKARILSNPYAYVPSVFENVEFRYSIAQDDIRRFKPDVIILTQSAHGRWSWKKDKTSLSQQDFYLNQGYPEAPAAKEFLEWITSSVGDYRIAYESEWCGVFKPN